MQRGFVAAMLVVAALGVTRAQEPDTSTAPRIQMAEFKALHAADAVLVVDVRDDVSFTNGHVPGALSMPIDKLLDPRSVETLKRSKKPIVLYCA